MALDLDVFEFENKNLPVSCFKLLYDMKLRSELCDVVIDGSSRNIAAHRVILASAIPYFRIMFGSGMEESKQERISVKNVDQQAMECIVNYVYTGQIQISAENVFNLLEASDYLQITEVRTACIKFLGRRLCQDNVLPILARADSLGIPNLIDDCVSCLRNCFQRFVYTRDFLSLPYQHLKKVISSEVLRCVGEETVFEAVLKWVKASSRDRAELLSHLLIEVRMTDLNQNYVRRRVLSQELLRSSAAWEGQLEQIRSQQYMLKAAGLMVPRKFVMDEMYAVCSAKTYSSIYYYTVDETWQYVASKVQDGTIAHVVALKEKLYMFLEHTVQVFHVTTCKWRTLSSTKNFIDGAAIVARGNLIYFLGSARPSFEDKMYALDTVENKWLQYDRMSVSRSYAAATSVAEHIYVTGGVINRGWHVGSNSVEKYDLLTHNWETVAPMPVARCCHACASVKGKIYVFGGEVCTPSAVMYDPQIDRWNFISATDLSSSNRFSLASCSGKIYALGSQIVSNRYVEVYDPERDEWSSGVQLPSSAKRYKNFPIFLTSVKGRTNLELRESLSEGVSHSLQRFKPEASSNFSQSSRSGGSSFSHSGVCLSTTGPVAKVRERNKQSVQMRQQQHGLNSTSAMNSTCSFDEARTSFGSRSACSRRTPSHLSPGKAVNRAGSCPSSQAPSRPISRSSSQAPSRPISRPSSRAPIRPISHPSSRPLSKPISPSGQFPSRPISLPSSKRLSRAASDLSSDSFEGYRARKLGSIGARQRTSSDSSQTSD